MDEARGRGLWSTKKKDAAPRGVFRHRSGVWAIRFTCGAGCIHKGKIGTIKTDAVSAYHEQRNRARREPGWCPGVEARRERERVRAELVKEKARMLFGQHADEYAKWAERHKRSWRTDKGRIAMLKERFGDKRLDEITPLDVERFRDSLLDTRSKATANRYRDLLSGMFRRAIRDGLVSVNPVRAVSKFKENNQRVAYLTPDEEGTVLAALPPEYRPHFLVSVNTGLRWSEQMGLRWGNVDLLTGFTVPLTKNGQARRVPINSVVRSALVDLAMRRERTDNPAERVFSPRPKQIGRLFPKAVERAAGTLRSTGKDAARADRYARCCGTSPRLARRGQTGRADAG